jgi:transposase-like protein
MARYSAERKEAILKQMMLAANKSIKELARENGISEPTLYSWRKGLKIEGKSVIGTEKDSEEWSSEEKFMVVVETAALNAAELAEYCRRKGLYAEQITQWKEVCALANANTRQKAKSAREESKEDKKRILRLEKELRRKEKALAETAALLVLRKKAKAIWGEAEED